MRIKSGTALIASAFAARESVQITFTGIACLVIVNANHNSAKLVNYGISTLANANA